MRRSEVAGSARLIFSVWLGGPWHEPGDERGLATQGVRGVVWWRPGCEAVAIPPGDVQGRLSVRAYQACRKSVIDCDRQSIGQLLHVWFVYTTQPCLLRQPGVSVSTLQSPCAITKDQVGLAVKTLGRLSASGSDYCNSATKSDIPSDAVVEQ